MASTAARTQAIKQAEATRPRAPKITNRANTVLSVPAGVYSTEVVGVKHELVAPTDFSLKNVIAGRSCWYVTTPENVMFILPFGKATLITMNADRTVVTDTNPA